MTPRAIKRPCDVDGCGLESAMWCPGIQRCADHIPPLVRVTAAGGESPDRERILALLARAKAAGRLIEP
jgi:hypothetical protein